MARTPAPNSEPAIQPVEPTGSAQQTATDPVPPPAPPEEGKQGDRSAPEGLAVSFPTRDQLVQAWGDHIIGRLRPKAKALFQAGRFVGVEGDRALFGLPNETHRIRCEEVRGEIESALSDHFGRPVPLTLMVDSGSGTPPAPEASPSLPSGKTTTAANAAAPASDRGAPAAEQIEDLSTFDEAELGEAVDVDNSAESRVLEAFPGAEEVG